MAFLTPTVDVAVNLELVDVLSGTLALAASRAAATRAAAVESAALGALEVAAGLVVAVAVLDTDDTEVFGATPFTLAVVVDVFCKTPPFNLDAAEVAVVFRMDVPTVDVLLTKDDEETCFEAASVRDVAVTPVFGAAVLRAGALVPDGLNVGFGAEAVTAGLVEPTVLVVVRVIVDFATEVVAAGFDATAPTLAAVAVRVAAAEVILAAGLVAGDAGFDARLLRVADTFEIGFAAGLIGSGSGLDATAATFRVGATVAVFLADCVTGVLVGLAEFVLAGVADLFAITSVTIGFAAADAAAATAAAIAVSDGNGV